MPSAVYNGPVVPTDTHNMILVDALLHSPEERLPDAGDYHKVEVGVREGEFTSWVGEWDQSAQKLDASTPTSVLNEGRLGMRLRAGQAVVVRITAVGIPASLRGARLTFRLALVGGRDGTASALVSAGAGISDASTRAAVRALERQINTGGLAEWDESVDVVDPVDLVVTGSLQGRLQYDSATQVSVQQVDGNWIEVDGVAVSIGSAGLIVTTSNQLLFTTSVVGASTTYYAYVGVDGSLRLSDSAPVLNRGVYYFSATGAGASWRYVGEVDTNGSTEFVDPVTPVNPAPSGGSTNALLDGTNHTDTTAGTVVRGDIIAGIGATPTWTRVAKGAAGTILTMGANEPAWSAPATQTSALLSATHTDTTAAAVTRGDIITGQAATPSWKRLALGNQGFVLTCGADEPFWGFPDNGAHPGWVRGRFPVFATTYGFTGSGAVSQFERGSVGMGAAANTVIPPTYSDQCGYFSNTAVGTMGVVGGASLAPQAYPYIRVVLKLEDCDNGTMWIGMFATAPTSAADPSNNAVAFRWRNGTDTNWNAVVRDGTTTQTNDTGVPPDASNYQLFEIDSPDAGVTYNFYINGSLVATETSNVPAVTTNMGFRIQNFAVASSTRVFRMKSSLACLGNIADADAFTDTEFGATI